MTTRRGASSLGCLFTMLIVAVVLYYGINIGGVYWRYYQFKDAMKQEIRFSGNLTNAQMLAHLRAQADTLGLPDDAHDISIQRTKNSITIEAEYYETIEMPLKKKDVLFNPRAESTP